jgi:hypothetical protein
MTERALELNSEAPEENQMTKPVKSLVFVLQTSENSGTKRNDVEYVDARMYWKWEISQCRKDLKKAERAYRQSIADAKKHKQAKTTGVNYDKMCKERTTATQEGVS